MNLVLTNKNDNKEYNIYDISYDSAGYPLFLIYKDEQWLRLSAKHFKPLHTYNDIINELKNMKCLTLNIN